MYIKIMLVHIQFLSTCTCIGSTDALATGIQAPTVTCKLVSIAIGTNYIKYQMLPAFLM